MNKVKISIICLAALLILLVVICIVFYKNSGKVQEPEVANNSSDYVTEDESTYSNDNDVTDANTVASVLEEIHSDTNDPLSANEWDQVLGELNGAFGKDDFEYLGYLEDTDNLFFYKLKNSDIVMSVETYDGNAGIEHFDNSISGDYAVIYFAKGMPENKEEIYKLDFDYNFYVTDYQGGNTVKYWSLDDPDNVMEMKIK